jgi:hypothetical protein
LAHREGIHNESACEKCIEMETQLKEDLHVIELSSAQLIIEILQIGSNMSTTSEHLINNISITLHEDVYHEVDNNWKLETSWHSSAPEKLMKHVTLPNSQMFATSNWYSILAAPKETEMVTRQANQRKMKHFT